jgi:ribosomal-protein-alanine N-acetyltransferase
MAFLRSPFAPDLPPILSGAKVLLRTPEAGDYAAWAAVREESRAFLVPWEPEWPANDLSKSAFRIRLKRYYRDIDDDTAYPFFIFSADGLRLMGAITLSNVRRGVAQMGTLGYWIGARYAGHGYMTEAVRLVLGFALDHLHLHRVEAACLPHNAASIALLRRAGFTEEGYARAYLRIDGRWQDHVLFGLSRDLR